MLRMTTNRGNMQERDFKMVELDGYDLVQIGVFT
jgi:hypothetical protein